MTINSDARHKVRTQGYYAQDQIKLNEAWQVLLGLRLDRFNIDSTNRLLDASASRSSSGVSPRAGVVGRRCATIPSTLRTARPSRPPAAASSASRPTRAATPMSWTRSAPASTKWASRATGWTAA